MAPSLLDTFRTLASFHPASSQPAKGSLADAPWESYVDWAISQGLGPMAAYNLEYVLLGAGAPQWVRDRLLSIYQGTLNDNVMKAVSFKRSVMMLEGRKVVVLGAASFAEALYPHLAFRPVDDIHLLVSPKEVSGLTGFLTDGDMKPVGPSALSDGRTTLHVHGSLFGGSTGGVLDQGLIERAIPFKLYGPSLYRLDLEDALLALVLEQARSGYTFPAIEWVDLRELLLGAPETGGPYSRAPRWDVLKARAAEARISRALYVSTATVARLFPQVSTNAAQAAPELRASSRALLERWVVEPSVELGKMRVMRGAERVRRLLTGGWLRGL